jgi:GAF domain-containing protein
MSKADLPRVLRRALGLMRFARTAISAKSTSPFLVGEDDRSLHGLISEWDWTRTSFSARLDDWPNVRESLVTGEVTCILAADAEGAEAGWFEAHGIRATLCVPLRDGARPLGVIFFDLTDDATRDRAAVALLADVGRRCARAFVRASFTMPEPEARWIP